MLYHTHENANENENEMRLFQCTYIYLSILIMMVWVGRRSQNGEGREGICSVEGCCVQYKSVLIHIWLSMGGETVEIREKNGRGGGNRGSSDKQQLY